MRQHRHSLHCGDKYGNPHMIYSRHVREKQVRKEWEPCLIKHFGNLLCTLPQDT